LQTLLGYLKNLQTVTPKPAAAQGQTIYNIHCTINNGVSKEKKNSRLMKNVSKRLARESKRLEHQWKLQLSETVTALADKKLLVGKAKELQEIPRPQAERKFSEVSDEFYQEDAKLSESEETLLEMSHEEESTCPSTEEIEMSTNQESRVDSGLDPQAIPEDEIIPLEAPVTSHVEMPLEPESIRLKRKYNKKSGVNKILQGSVKSKQDKLGFKIDQRRIKSGRVLKKSKWEVDKPIPKTLRLGVMNAISVPCAGTSVMASAEGHEEKKKNKDKVNASTPKLPELQLVNIETVKFARTAEAPEVIEAKKEGVKKKGRNEANASTSKLPGFQIGDTQTEQLALALEVIDEIEKVQKKNEVNPLTSELPGLQFENTVTEKLAGTSEMLEMVEALTKITRPLILKIKPLLLMHLNLF